MHEQDEMGDRDTPLWILNTYSVFDKRLQSESAYLHLAMRGLHTIRKVRNAVETLDSSAINIASPGSEQHLRKEALRRDVEWITGQADLGFPLLHAHATVGIWSALEVLSEDLAKEWLRNTPEAWRCEQIDRLKVPLAQFNRMTPMERVDFVVEQLYQSIGVDLKKGYGSLTAVLELFRLKPDIGHNARLALTELREMRNAIVHKGGLVDATLAERVPWLSLKCDQPIDINHAVFSWYMQAARVYAERLVNRASELSGGPVCRCPGVNEVAPRPGGTLL